ncbi:MAG: dihydrofolate reductase [Actinobacteria bacterium]|nr:MAG: dihydrofolate reductase [Actinomycetota bacterium]
MLEVIYYVASSLDGFIATPDGGVDWLAPFQDSDEDYGYSAFYDSIDAILIGSRTYEQSLTFGEWPYPGKPVWVFSRRPLAVGGDDVMVTDRKPREVLGEIESRGLRRAWLVGGGALAGSMRASGLITEYVVSIMPVTLGAGIGVFGASGPPERLQRQQTTEYPDGVLQVRYSPA